MNLDNNVALIDEEDEAGIDGGEAHCDGCGRQHQILYHHYDEEETRDLWQCADCLAKYQNRVGGQSGKG